MRTIHSITQLVLSNALDRVTANEMEAQDLDFKEWSYRAKGFKTQLKDNLKKMLQMAVCMANGGGGHVVFGIADSKKGREESIIGVPTNLDKNKIANYIYQKTEPRIQVKITEVNVPYGTKKVLIISMTGETPPYTQSDGRGSVRQGTDCLPLTGTIRRQMIQRQTHFDYTNELLEGDWKQYISAAALEYVRENMQKESGPQDLIDQSDYSLLQTIGAIRNEKLTRGGLLLFGKAEEIRRCIPTHQWAYRKMKSDIDYIYREEGYDSLAIAARELEKNIQRDNEVLTVELGLFHHEYPRFPSIAIREALLNALAHRDYELSGATMVKQYLNRIEISNPGTFIKGITPENILHHASTPRNIHLMDLLDRVRLVNRTNLGVPRIYESLLREGKEPPNYKDSGAQITLTMLSSEISPEFKDFIKEEQKNGNFLDVDDLLVLQYLLKHAKSNIQDLSKVTQRTHEIAKEQLSKLVNIGVLERLGIGTGQNYILSQRVSKRLKGNLAYERNHELDEERVKLQIISYISNNGKMTRAEIVQMTGWNSQQVYRYMVKLRREKLVQSKGHGKGAYYCLYEE